MERYLTHCFICMQFGLAQTPMKAYFLKREERVWLDNRQKREAQIRANANPHTSSMIGKSNKQLLVHGMHGHSMLPVTSNHGLTHPCAFISLPEDATPELTSSICMAGGAEHVQPSLTWHLKSGCLF